VNLYAALSVVLYPSYGETKNQLLDFMGLTDKHDWTTLHTTLANLFVHAQNNDHANVSITQGDFVQNGFAINETFRKFAEDVYKCKVANVDFANKGQETLDYINSWVSEHTGGQIEKVTDGPYPVETVMVLVSALYFHANWLNPFANYTTTKGDFTYNGEQFKVDYMSLTKSAQYYEDTEGKFRALGLPYENDEFTFYYVIPTEGETFPNFISNFKKEYFTKIFGAPKVDVKYKVPKMKLEYNTDLKDHFYALGLHDLFDKADLRYLASKIQVSKITHKVELEVREEGTIGAAATTVQFVKYGLQIYPKDLTEFYVDQPFLFFIHHKATNFIVFHGVVNKPTY